MKTLLYLTMISLLATVAYAGQGTSTGLISFELPPAQSKKDLADRWEKISAEKRKQIESYLMMGLGLSSTGAIYLTGVYDQGTGAKDDNKNMLFQFQHLDLEGSRLFWTALVNPEASTVRVLFHLNEKHVTSQFVPIRRE
jgi:hypothetical protein